MPLKRALPFLAGTSREQLLIIAVAFVQGLLLYPLYRAVSAGAWPGGHPLPLYLLFTLLLVVPWFFLLLLEPGALRRVLVATSAYALVCAIAASWTGWQSLPADHVDNSTMLPAYVLTMLIASFKALMYAQQYVRKQGISYPALLKTSWRLFLLCGLSGMFVLLVQGVLLLWGALFDLIGVGIFSFVFRSSWFVIPVGTTSFGLGIILFGNLDHVIDNLTRLLRTMLRFLLPVVSVIALLFIVFLPFTGLQPIWDARLGSLTLLWLMALLLFMVNAVYQGIHDSSLSTQSLPYSLGLHRLIAIAVASLPVFGILALHGLFTRIAQYSLTVDRLWGLIVALSLLGFAVGYLWSVVRLRDHWLGGLHRINIAMGLAVLLVTFASNTPLLDLQQWSARSQLARLDHGLTPDSLDLQYFRRSLGRAGHEALQELKQRHAGDEKLIGRIDALYAPPPQAPQTVDDLRTRLSVWPQGREIPQTVLADLLASQLANSTNFSHAWLLFSDLDGDARDEVVFVSDQRGFAATQLFWSSAGGNWVQHRYQRRNSAPAEVLDTLIREGRITTETAQWRRLRIGDMTLEPVE